MSQDDPFGDSGDDDRTVIKPSPGGRRGRPVQHSERLEKAHPIPTQLPKVQSNENRLLGSAFGLLTLANQLRNTVAHDDIEGLRADVIKEIRDFESNALQQGVLEDKVQTARYALCSLIDESVLNTPWGSKSIWGQKSLLIAFHKEGWGGEKFFQLLNRLVRQPAANLDLLELFYYCLSMGFEGKYRIHEQGVTKLEQLRENLYVLIQRQQGDYEQQLSIRWEGLRDRRNALIRYVPLWVVGAVAAALLMVVYLGFNYMINRDSDPVFKELYALGREKPPRAAISPSRVLLDDLRIKLAPEIERGLLEVTENQEGTVIRIRGLFASGKDQVKQSLLSLLSRIAQALQNVSERIIVAGHTDNVPIFTARFPSNWHLSQARAKAVTEILQTTVRFDNAIESEGRADNQPLVDNDTSSNRTINRRVDIIVR